MSWLIAAVSLFVGFALGVVAVCACAEFRAKRVLRLRLDESVMGLYYFALLALGIHWLWRLCR